MKTKRRLHRPRRKNSAGPRRPPRGSHRRGLPLTGGDVRCQAPARSTWADQDTSAKIAYDGGAAQLFGDDSWKWMLLQPSLADNQE